MSQWNNSYAYNNEYQGASEWNGDVNSQYVDQPYYSNPGNQYVSFNEFISQMQGANSNNAASSSAGNYSNMQYPNYQPNQYDYHNMPSTSQNAQSDTSGYSTNTQESANSHNKSLSSPPQTDTKSYMSDVVSKSNLTATAMEFVPKSSKIKISSSTQNVHPEPSTSHSHLKESKSIHGSSSDRNWRERPQSSSQNGGGENYKNNENPPNNGGHKNYESNNFNRESIGRRNREFNGRHNEPSDSYSQEPREPRRNQEYNMRNNDNQYENNYTEGGRNDNNRYESNSRYDQKNNRSKPKKDDRTYYNSSMSKSSQDVRSSKGEGSGRKNWVGTQRLRTNDRNYVEDEQFANTYLQHKDYKDNRERKSEVSPKNKKPMLESGDNKEMTQRERLSEQLEKGTLECLVCCERVKQTDAVWSCTNCYHVLHLRCIKKWATSSIVEGKWRCPACQNTSGSVPSEYRCMCGSARNPGWSRGSHTPHTCGRACRRPRLCTHPCALLCHPGPCPPCLATQHRTCGCGAESHSVVCSNKTPLICGRTCGRLLNCNVHKCTKLCHEGPCEACAEEITQVCYCVAGVPRTVQCSAGTRGGAGGAGWSCGAPCGRVLACGAHCCRALCHAPPCAPCANLPELTTSCPCGRTRLEKESRKKCTDPIPLCGNICAKPLPCGPQGDRHFCKMNCHEGDCPPCPDKTLMQCRCGHSSREILCTELPEVVLCQKKCNKKLSCGRHRCRSTCCAASSHRCAVVCGRTLSCQLHRCEQFCHTGHCAPCPRQSFTELRCECGREVLLPPVPCGARPPACQAACPRVRPCGHPPHHSCHAGPCPPCVVLTTKKCHAGHEERKTIPCSQEEFSCGLPCGKPLPCGKHTCIKICHKGPCDTAKCVQPCLVKRAACGHGCAAPCHSSAAAACPSAAPCRRTVTAVCGCGRRKQDKTCQDNARDHAKIVSALTAAKMQEDGSVDLSEVQRPGAVLKTLECDDECRVEARTRQLALALQIRNPDVSAKLAPRYGDGLRAMAAKDPNFAQNVHDKLTELVQRAKKSKQKTRSHSFPSMNWQKRQFIHEMCEHFGCESVAYDAEPNRNVVATADKEKSWLPAMSILEVISREAGRRRVPPPVLRAGKQLQNTATPSSAPTTTNKSPGGWATLTSTNAWAARSQARQTMAEHPSEKIDYFDNPPDN